MYNNGLWLFALTPICFVVQYFVQPAYLSTTVYDRTSDRILHRIRYSCSVLVAMMVSTSLEATILDQQTSNLRREFELLGEDMSGGVAEALVGSGTDRDERHKLAHGWKTRRRTVPYSTSQYGSWCFVRCRTNVRKKTRRLSFVRFA